MAAFPWSWCGTKAPEMFWEERDAKERILPHEIKDAKESFPEDQGQPSPAQAAFLGGTAQGFPPVPSAG